MVECDSFIPQFYDKIEETLKPLFEFVVDPTNIEFEDDIVLTLKTFIKKTKSVSSTLWTIYPHLMKVFAKNKYAFVNLLDTLNLFLLHGQEQFINNREYIVMLLEIGKLSLFCMEAPITILNAEGCIFFELLFQVFRNTNALNEFFEEILNKIVERSRSQPMQDYLKRHLVCVFLCAMSYNSQATFAYLEKNNLTQPMLDQIFNLSSNFTNSYERKLFAIGLSCMLVSPYIPQSIIPQVKKIIEHIIIILNKQKNMETRSLRKAGK